MRGIAAVNRSPKSSESPDLEDPRLNDYEAELIAAMDHVTEPEIKGRRY